MLRAGMFAAEQKTPPFGGLRQSLVDRSSMARYTTAQTDTEAARQQRYVLALHPAVQAFRPIHSDNTVP
jgi:hypothetical protein